MRKARSVAWFSTAGFHQRSKCTTCEAAVRFSPAPPAFSDSTKNGTASSSWNCRTSACRCLTAVSPCSTRPARPNTPPRNAASGAVISRNWVKTSIFSCRAATTSAISRSRASLPLSASAQPPSPSHCEGWLQICLRRISIASTMPAPDAVGVLQLRGQLLDRLRIERRLPAAELAIRRDLGLVGQVGDDRAVGLHPPQDVGPHQLAQRAVGIVLPLGEALGVAGELPRRAEQARVDEVEDRPEIAEAVLDRRAGQRDARLRLQRLGRPGLPGARVLDRLRLVEDGQAPVDLGEHGQAQQRAVAGDRPGRARPPASA